MNIIIIIMINIACEYICNYTCTYRAYIIILNYVYFQDDLSYSGIPTMS